MSRSEFTTQALGFQVLEVNLSTKTWTWVIYNFLSIEASDATQCKLNSIYYTDECVEHSCRRMLRRQRGGNDIIRGFIMWKMELLSRILAANCGV